MGDETVTCPSCQREILRSLTVCPCGTANHRYEPAGPPPPGRATPSATARRASGACCFELDGMRCPLVAVWWPHAYSKGSPGYCRIHADELARAHDAAASRELRSILDHPEQHARTGPHWSDAAVAGVLAENPGWARQVGESRDDYRERMQALRERLAPRGLLPPRPARRGPPPREMTMSREELVGDALEQLEERAGKYQAEGTPRELATRLALEDVLRERLGAA